MTKQSKFVSPEEAVRAVRAGDWVDYGFGGGFPELLDRALAARRDELSEVKIRGGLVIRPRIEAVECDPEQKAFSYYSWHIGDYERKLQSRGLCRFLPMVLRYLPELYRSHMCGLVGGSVSLLECALKVLLCSSSTQYRRDSLLFAFGTRCRTLSPSSITPAWMLPCFPP